MIKVTKAPLDNKHVHFAPEETSRGTILLKAAKVIQVSHKWAVEPIRLGWHLELEKGTTGFISLHPWLVHRGVILLNPVALPGCDEPLTLWIGQSGGHYPLNISAGQVVGEMSLVTNMTKALKLKFLDSE